MGRYLCVRWHDRSDCSRLCGKYYLADKGSHRPEARLVYALLYPILVSFSGGELIFDLCILLLSRY